MRPQPWIIRKREQNRLHYLGTVRHPGRIALVNTVASQTDALTLDIGLTLLQLHERGVYQDFDSRTRRVSRRFHHDPTYRTFLD